MGRMGRGVRRRGTGGARWGIRRGGWLGGAGRVDDVSKVARSAARADARGPSSRLPAADAREDRAGGACREAAHAGEVVLRRVGAGCRHCWLQTPRRGARVFPCSGCGTPRATRRAGLRDVRPTGTSRSSDAASTGWCGGQCAGSRGMARAASPANTRPGTRRNRAVSALMRRFSAGSAPPGTEPPDGGHAVKPCRRLATAGGPSPAQACHMRDDCHDPRRDARSLSAAARRRRDGLRAVRVAVEEGAGPVAATAAATAGRGAPRRGTHRFVIPAAGLIGGAA